MASTTNFDEINKLSAKDEKRVKAIDYDTYFGEMDLDDDQIAERIALAKKLESVFAFLFALVASAKVTGAEVDISYLISTTEQRFRDAVLECGLELGDDTYLANYVTEVITSIVDTTVNNQTDEYYLSNDRAMYDAENETNAVYNYKDMKTAIANGMNAKRWVTKKDMRVRHTHVLADEQVVGINDTFLVGDSEMLFPKDSSYDADPKEIVNCRCVAKYFYSDKYSKIQGTV